MIEVLEDDILASALIEKSLISRAQLDQVRSEIDPSQFDTSLVGHLLLKRLVHENDLADLIAQTFAVPRMTIAGEVLSTPKETFPPELSSRFYLLPVFEIG